MPFVFPRLKLLKQVSGIAVYMVDGLWVRHNLEPDFTDFGAWPAFRSIPRNEFWIDQENRPDEHKFYLTNMLAEREAVDSGVDPKAAGKIGNLAEQLARRKHEPTKPADAVDRVKLTKITRLPGGVVVWLVDGELVRSWFDINFAEGGHDLVYSYVPSGEIWIDADVLDQEQELVLLHESTERSLMLNGLSYEDAHNRALAVEQRGYSTLDKVAEVKSGSAPVLVKFRSRLYRLSER